MRVSKCFCWSSALQVVLFLLHNPLLALPLLPLLLLLAFPRPEGTLAVAGSSDSGPSSISVTGEEGLEEDHLGILL
jgi:hypothetical protein